jgi:TRAP transporter 4TM/12TM fusion protein
MEATKALDKSGEALAAGRNRQFTGLMGKFVSGLSIALSLYIILYVAGLWDWVALNYLGKYLGFASFWGPHRPLAYAFTLLLVFLLAPARKGARRDYLPWYDVVLGVGGAISSFYVFLHWDDVRNFYAVPTIPQLVMGGIVLVATLEAARRTLGLALMALGAFFIFYTMYGDHFPGFLLTKGYSYPRMIGHYYLSATGLFGSAMEVFTAVVAMFVIFAQFIQMSGAGEFFLKLGMSVVGRFRGGPAKVAVFSSSLFGTVSGLAVANVVSTGSITIPMMKRSGYKPHFAGAVESAASNGGQIMPPVMGAAAFLMADMLGMPYWAVVVAAFLPALLYYIALYFMLDFEAARTGLRGLPREQLPSVLGTLKEGWYFLVPMIVLVVLIGNEGWTAQKAGLYATITLVLINMMVVLYGKRHESSRSQLYLAVIVLLMLLQVAIFLIPRFIPDTATLVTMPLVFLVVVPSLFLLRGTRMGPGVMVGALQRGANSMAQLGPAAAIIGILMGAVSLTGLGVTLSSGLLEASGGSMPVLLILTALACIIMGMGSSTLLVYVVLAIFIAPALIQMGIPPLAAHLFIFYFGMMSLITPPVALAAYAAAAVAEADFWKTGLQAARLGIVGYIVPFMFVFQPPLLLQGTIGEIVVSTSTAIIGAIALAGAMSGYLLGRAQWWERLFLAAAALTLIYPGWATDLAGLALLAVPVARMAVFRRSQPLPVLGSGGEASGALGSQSKRD